ncbi:MAG: ankyrin repeat domain-containing protein, partial [Rickettsiaceae bacterium]|nr:ankyrin repeat domain-containing protein [Rickettsiaceae bacterium]
FSKIIKEKLNSYGFNFKNLRDDIGHICEKIPNLTKFIKFLNDDKILQDIKNLTTNYKTLLIELKENLQALAKDPSLEINCILGLHEDSKEILGKRWIHKALRSVELEEDDKIFIGESYVNRQIEVMKFAIKKIQEIVDIVSVKNNNDYNKMRQELQSPKIHSECLFFLTMIGQSIQTIKTNENFLSIVTFDLLKELDFLKWVRNSLMHLDKVNEKGTLIDYLANDLLTDFSITTHGQKIIEFSKYFDYVLNLLDEFQITVTHLGDSNYFQEYKGEDKKYLDFDINRKEVALEKVLEKNNKQKHTDFFSQKSNKSGFIIDKIIELKEEINQKSQELNIEIIGTFGKLAKFGYSIQGDNSGILVKVSENDILVSLAEFKQYIYDLFKYRIKIIEERQLIEYLELKIDNESDRREFSKAFLQKTKKYSLEHLENNIKLFQFIEELNDTTNEYTSQQEALSYLLIDVSANNLINSNKFEIFWKLSNLLHSNDSQVTKEIQTEIKAIQQKHSALNSSLEWTSSEKIAQIAISQDLLSLLIKFYKEEQFKTQQTLEVQIKNIHEFLDSTEKISFELIYKEQEPILHSLCKNYQQTKLNPLLELLRVILQKGADIDVQDIYGNTILHNISWYECDKQLLDCINEYIQKRDYNQLNLDNKCPLEMAIENNNFQLIEFLKDKTDVKEYGKELLIKATKYGNVELVKYLILEHQVDCNTQDETGRPIIHYAIFKHSLASETNHLQELQLNEQYREIIKLLIENGAVVSQFYDQYSHEQEVPLLWALENKDIELALLLVETAIEVSYNNTNQNCPIHLAILNLKDCPLQQRPDYLKLINKIAEKAMVNGDGLNQEYQGSSETPIYLAAQQEDIEVMKILLQNGANVNYKNHRFISQVLSKVKNLEVIKLFIEHGIRLDLKDCTDFIQNRQDSYVIALEKLDKIIADEDTLEVLKGKVESIYRKIYPYYIDFDKINTIEKIKEEIVKLKKFLQIQSLEDLSQIKEYLNNHAQLFKLYKSNKVDELKEFIGKTLINLQVVNEEGKDLFCYALKEQDISFIKWLSDHNGINTNVRFADPCKANPNRETSYYRHLSNCASGEILEALHNKGLIDWSKFDDYEIKLISEKALKNNDLKIIELLENYKYMDIPPSINRFSDENLVKQYLLPYLKVFKQIEQHDEIEELKIAIRSLQNKLVFFKDMSLLHAAVCAGNLGIVRFLIEEVGLNINVQNWIENTLLDKAVEVNSSLEMLTYLVQNGAQFSRNFDFDSILDLDSDKQTLLLHYIKTTSQIKETIMSLANSCLSNPDAIRVLLELGWDPNEYEENVNIFSGGYTALHKCIINEGYNKTLEVLCKNGQIDLEAPIGNFIIWATSGVRTPVGWALEHSNFVGAKILIEHGASPYKYLGVLLIDALYNEDSEYLKLLLEKSIIIDPEEVSSYLTHWIADSITADKIFKAFQNLHQIQDFDGIKEILPDHIYLLIFTEAIKRLPQLSVTDDEKVLLVSTVFEKMSDEQKDLALSESISRGNKFIKSKNYIDALAIFESIDNLFLIEEVNLQNYIILNVAKCYLHLNNLDKASQIVDYLSSSNYSSKELLLIKQKIALEYNKLYPDPLFVSLSLPYPWDFDITGKLPSDNDNPCLAPRDTSSLFGEIREESTD